MCLRYSYGVSESILIVFTVSGRPLRNHSKRLYFAQIILELASTTKDSRRTHPILSPFLCNLHNTQLDTINTLNVSLHTTYSLATPVWCRQHTEDRQPWQLSSSKKERMSTLSTGLVKQTLSLPCPALFRFVLSSPFPLHLPSLLLFHLLYFLFVLHLLHVIISFHFFNQNLIWFDLIWSDLISFSSVFISCTSINLIYVRNTNR